MTVAATRQRDDFDSFCQVNEAQDIAQESFAAPGNRAGGSVRLMSLHGSKVSVDDAPAGADPHVGEYLWTRKEFVG